MNPRFGVVGHGQKATRTTQTKATSLEVHVDTSNLVILLFPDTSNLSTTQEMGKSSFPESFPEQGAKLTDPSPRYNQDISVRRRQRMQPCDSSVDKKMMKVTSWSAADVVKSRMRDEGSLEDGVETRYKEKILQIERERF